MDSGIKRNIFAIKLHLIIVVCACIISVYTCKSSPVPELIKTNESDQAISCSVGDRQSILPLSNPETHRLPVYGKVITSDAMSIKRAIVEQVELYPKEDAQSDKTIMRKGMLVRYPQAKATILVCHGFMCDRFDVGLLRQVFSKDYNIMTFDFRAHGENREGQYCTFGYNESQDVIAAAQFLRNHPDLRNKPLFVYGFSMGAVASIEAQSQAALFDAMILDCPFDSTENVIKRGLANMKINIFGYEFAVPGRSYLEQYAFHPYVQSLVKALLKTVANFDPQDIQITLHPCSPVESIKKVDVPCFFIHCRNDEKVPLEAVKEVFAGAKGLKKLWVTNGRRHFDSYFYNPEKYTQQVKSFLKSMLGETTTTAIVTDGAIIEDVDQKDTEKDEKKGEE